MAENPSEEEEPSIEEILASIRQIISDDDEEAGDESEADSGDEDVIDDPIRHENNDVLELTEDDLAESDPEPEPEPEEMPEPEVEMIDRLEEEAQMDPEPKPEARPVPSDILSSGTQSAALGSISKLKSKMPIESSRSYDGVTLEDIVRELLHPMLREWMDDNLPPMVERIVQKELEKLARRAMDD